MPGGQLPIDDEGLCCLGDQHNSWVGVTCLQVRSRLILLCCSALFLCMRCDAGGSNACCVMRPWQL